MKEKRGNMHRFPHMYRDLGWLENGYDMMQKQLELSDKCIHLHPYTWQKVSRLGSNVYFQHFNNTTDGSRKSYQIS
jgi:hypothetical protein